MTNCEAIRQWNLDTELRPTGRDSIALNCGKGCGLEKLQPVIDAVGVWTADPDERRARGTHSLAEFAVPLPAAPEAP